MSQNMDVTNMIWRPALLKLTSMPHPDVDNGATAALFVDPAAISQIRRVLVIQKKAPEFVEPHPGQMGTELHCCHYIVHVMESCEQVALLRDKALGHAPALGSV